MKEISIKRKFHNPMTVCWQGLASQTCTQSELMPTFGWP